MISAPPDQPDQAQHTISQGLKDECARVVRGIYGKELAKAKFDSFRICCKSPITIALCLSNRLNRGWVYTKPGLYYFSSSKMQESVCCDRRLISRVEILAHYWRLCGAASGRQAPRRSCQKMGLGPFSGWLGPREDQSEARAGRCIMRKSHALKDLPHNQ